MVQHVSDRSDTRADLVDAALDLFGEGGFAAVSTRSLADRAGANLAAIQYHFGGKEALYVAVIDRVIEVVALRVADAEAMFAAVRDSLASNPRAQAALIDRMVNLLTRSLLLDNEVRRFVPFILREMFHPSAHFDRFFEAVPGRLHRLLAGLVGIIRNEPAESTKVILQTHALIGQLIVFLIGQPILLRRLHWPEYSPDAVEQILATLVPSLLSSLGLPVTPRDLSESPSTPAKDPT
jgi:AcrR family transcriptional regulator